MEEQTPKPSSFKVRAPVSLGLVSLSSVSGEDEIVLPANAVDSFQDLTFSSIPRLYGTPAEQQPFSYENETVKIWETLTSGTQRDIDPSIGSYQIHIRTGVYSLEHLFERYSEVRKVINEIEKVWPYVAGEPLWPVIPHWNLTLAVPGWQSNTAELKELYSKSARGPFVVMRKQHRHWMLLPYYPLKLALIARGALATSDNTVQTLVELHAQALSATSYHSRLFLFAKALELASKFLPGDSPADKDKKMEAELKNRLTRPLNWLYMIANQRQQVRHVVSDPEGPKLHQFATGEEITEFEKNCDAILTFCVCKQLEIPAPRVFPASAMPKTDAIPPP